MARVESIVSAKAYALRETLVGPRGHLVRVRAVVDERELLAGAVLHVPVEAVVACVQLRAREPTSKSSHALICTCASLKPLAQKVRELLRAERLREVK